MPCPCPYILCFTFIRSSLCEVCFSLTFGGYCDEHLSSWWSHQTNIENISDDPMIAKYWKSLVIQWSWWWSLHCRLGGPASTNQNQQFLAANQLEDLVSPKITSQILKTSLMVQWSRWWSLHCGLGGPASPATIRRPLQAGSKYIIASATMSCHHPHCQRHCHHHRH